MAIDGPSSATFLAQSSSAITLGGNNVVDLSDPKALPKLPRPYPSRGVVNSNGNRAVKPLKARPNVPNRYTSLSPTYAPADLINRASRAWENTVVRSTTATRHIANGNIRARVLRLACGSRKELDKANIKTRTA